MKYSNSCTIDKDSLCFTDSIVIDTFTIDFPDSPNRIASIYGNTWNNIPVRVRFKFLNTNNQNINALLSDKIYLYEAGTKKGICTKGRCMYGGSYALYATLTQNEYSRGFYKRTHNRNRRVKVEENGVSELIFYVHVRDIAILQKKYALGAYLTVRDEPDPQRNFITKGRTSRVILTVMLPVKYANASMWKLIEKSDIYTSSRDENLLSEVSYHEPEIKIICTQYKLACCLLSHLSPVRFSVIATGLAPESSLLTFTGLTPVATSASISANTNDINRIATFESWLIPLHDRDVHMQLKLNQGEFRVRILKKKSSRISTYLPGINNNTDGITLIKVTVVISGDDLNILPYSHLESHVTISDNIGYNQTLQIYCQQGGIPFIAG